MTTRSGRRAAMSLAWLALLVAPGARAALEDEIQVYLDDLNAPGEFGLQLHANATPSGRTRPEYAGEVVSAGGARLTAEFALGLGHGLEAGLYVPSAYDGHGTVEIPGLKLRLKWIGVDAEHHAGWFAGANVEVGRVSHRYEEAENVAELRFISGREIGAWLVAVNPIFDFDLRNGGSPDFNAGFKVARTVARGVQLGGEYYADLGLIREHATFQQQDHRLYAVVDIDRKPLQLNLGLGYGLTDAADRWTVKAIVTVPF